MTARLAVMLTRPIVIATAGLLGWLAFAYLVMQRYHGGPPGSGFDLEFVIAGHGRASQIATPARNAVQPTMKTSRG